MSPQPHEITRWLVFILAVWIVPVPVVNTVTVRTPPKTPGAATVQAQSKFFQDFFSVQLSPYNIEFGHVCEDPDTWEQRYEKKDFKNHRDMGKVRWGDKQGGYGEHYWDLNHAGAGDDSHGDDGYSNSHDHDNDRHSDSYDDSPHYGNDDSTQYESGHQHDADRLSNYDEPSQYDADGSRSKRAHSRVKTDKKSKRKVVAEQEDDDENDNQKETNHERFQTASTQVDKKAETTPRKTHVYRGQTNHKRAQYDSTSKEAAEKINDEQNTNEGVESYTPAVQKEEPQYVPYERGAGIRQHQKQLAAASVPRLFLEPSTGHVVDRATGQAYVLQPIIIN